MILIKAKLASVFQKQEQQKQQPPSQKEMDNWTYNNVKKFSLASSDYEPTKILKVYDGDSMTIAVVVDGKVFKTSCRVLHINTPELKSYCPIEKRMAKLAKQRATDLVLNQVIAIKRYDFDKYGRVLVDIKPGDSLLSDILRDEHLGYSYEGTKKFARIAVPTDYEACCEHCRFHLTYRRNCYMWHQLEKNWQIRQKT
jgi:endonuclease YncB( thermonuclease family)